MRRIPAFVYSALCYCIFLGTFLYAIGFVGNLPVPKSTDSDPREILTLTLLLLFWKWEPIGGVVWSLETPLGRALMYAGFAFEWLLVLIATFLIDHFDLFGLKQVYLSTRVRKYGCVVAGGSAIRCLQPAKPLALPGQVNNPLAD